MTKEHAVPTAIALRVAEGLMRTGRALSHSAGSGFICLRAAAGGFYWVAYDGSQILRGDDIKATTSLQGGFVAAMERTGS
jgi:hypothetical protein